MIKPNIAAVLFAIAFGTSAIADTNAAETKPSPAKPAIPSAASVEPGLDLARRHGCFTCHALDKPVVGPAWKDVAAKYRGDAKAEDWLVKKISKGGKGVWRKDLAMPPFSPRMKEADIRIIAKYILSLK